MTLTACPRCNQPRAGEQRFCPSCGLDYWQAAAGNVPATPAPPAPAPKSGGRSIPRWLLIVGALALALVIAYVALQGVASNLLGDVANDVPGQSPTGQTTSDCSDDMEAFVDALQDLDSRLNVGLNFQSYSDRVGDLRVAYDRIEVADETADCLRLVGTQAEDAMNEYIEAYSLWNDCIGDAECDNDSITPDLQAHWADATDLVDDAREAMD